MINFVASPRKSFLLYFFNNFCSIAGMSWSEFHLKEVSEFLKNGLWGIVNETLTVVLRQVGRG